MSLSEASQVPEPDIVEVLALVVCVCDLNYLGLVLLVMMRILTVHVFKYMMCPLHWGYNTYVLTNI